MVDVGVGGGTVEVEGHVAGWVAVVAVFAIKRAVLDGGEGADVYAGGDGFAGGGG